MNYWLMKSEPDVFSIDDLGMSRGKQTFWDGVRNYQARNFMREMRLGDLAFFYHSNAKLTGVAGIAKVVNLAAVDPTAFDPNDPHYDPQSKRENPRWDGVKIQLVRKLGRVITLQELRAHRPLTGMMLLQRGSRLSITPVSAEHWRGVLSLERS
jgi:predicted RNA-binding protein with PUA-like domain